MNQLAKKSPDGRGYLEALPSDYADTNELYPCIFFLSGSGERGDGSPAQLERLKNQGIPKQIKNGATMEFTVNGRLEKFIVLSPQQSTTRDSYEGKEFMPFVRWALSFYRIDPARVYLTGLSMGSDGTWMLSYSVENEPNVFTAIAPVSGKGVYNGGITTAKRKIPTWIFWGEKDTAVPYNDGRNPFYGMRDSKIDVFYKWEVIPGGTHSGSTWDIVYSPTGPYKLYEWFLSYGTPTIPPVPVPDVILDVVKTEYNKTKSKIIYTLVDGTIIEQ